MKLFKEKPDYVRLDDDVSFQILRTNPKLTSNAKLMYDGENLFLEAYPAAPILSTRTYKNHRVWQTGLYNRDLRNFLIGSNTATYTVGQSVQDTILLNGFDNQFENMYWCGVESINSDAYPQEMGCIAPLYLRKKRPNYFVIFKIDTPANTNTNERVNDYVADFEADVKSKAKIIKAFDLREGTPIGNYIKRYVSQRNFDYDKSIYVNFSSHEIYYYGIDKSSGVLTQKVENFEDQLLNNDNTIMKMDDWITSGFERNNLIFPYIINFEFLFDDKETSEYEFARYFGMYCNDIDLYDLNVTGVQYYDGERRYESEKEWKKLGGKKIKSSTLTLEWSDEDNEIQMSDNNFYYIKDKFNNIYTTKKSYVPGIFNIDGKIDVDSFTGFETDSVSTYAERIPGSGHTTMVLEILDLIGSNVNVIVENNISGNSVATFTSIDDPNYGAGEYYNNYFSCKGTLKDIAKALAGAIRTCNVDEFRWVTAFNIDNKVVIRSIHPGSGLNNVFNITFDSLTLNASQKKIDKITDNFDGGTDIEGCLFKIYTSDKNMFFDESGLDRDPYRYLKCGSGRNNAKILVSLPYITDDKQIDEDYTVIVTDRQGPFVNISKTDQVEIIDRFYAKLGVLSFFPVRDFDFDTVSSAYGEYTMMKKELEKVKIVTDDGESDSDEDSVLSEIPYGRFYNQNGDAIGTEYEYFFENFVPELCTENKSVPYIVKWGYIDESKDSCENPYRLNTSKIFETCNFSANTFMQKTDIFEYTHSMPYYVNNGYHNNTGLSTEEAKNELNNEYQYIIVPSNLWNYSKIGSYKQIKEAWIQYFSQKKSNGNSDPFDALFGDTSRSMFTNKRFNKKYSRFLSGNSVNKSSTLFRGVKFEITELDGEKEVKTGKYNDYKFSFLYIPYKNVITEETGNKDNHTVYFIKNDDFKFIVGLVLFDIRDDVASSGSSGSEFNKSYVYSRGMGYKDVALDNTNNLDNNN